MAFHVDVTQFIDIYNLLICKLMLLSNQRRFASRYYHIKYMYVSNLASKSSSVRWCLLPDNQWLSLWITERLQNRTKNIIPILVKQINIVLLSKNKHSKYVKPTGMMGYQ